MYEHDATEVAFKNGYESGVKETIGIIQDKITKKLTELTVLRNKQQEQYLNSNSALEYIANLDGKIAGLIELDYFIDELNGNIKN